MPLEQKKPLKPWELTNKVQSTRSIGSAQGKHADGPSRPVIPRRNASFGLGCAGQRSSTKASHARCSPPHPPIFRDNVWQGPRPSPRQKQLLIDVIVLLPQLQASDYDTSLILENPKPCANQNHDFRDVFL